MTDFSTLLQPDRGEPASLIHVVDKDTFTVWAKKQTSSRQSMLAAIRFDGKSVFQFAILQGRKDGEFDIVTCVDKAGALALGSADAAPLQPGGAVADAVSALVNLGYRRAEAYGAVAAAARTLGQEAAIGALIGAGLKELGR